MDKRAMLIWMALTPLVGCTSLPFVLEKELPARMDAMLVEDRKQISQLQQRVLAQDTKLEDAARQLEALSETVTQFGEQMEDQARTFQTLAEGLQASTSRLDASVAALPADTLRLFSNALQEFLTVREVAEEAEVLWGDEEEESAEAEDAEPVPGDVAAAVEKDATPAR